MLLPGEGAPATRLELLELVQEFGAMMGGINAGVNLGDLPVGIDQERVSRGEFRDPQIGE